MVDDIYLQLSVVCNSLTVKVRQRVGVGVRLKALPHFFHGSDGGSGFAGWNLGTVIKTTFTPSGLSSSIHGLGISPLGPLTLLPLLPTSDRFTAGRPWEKSLKRRNSSQFGQCEALKASSIVFSNAAFSTVAFISHNQHLSHIFGHPQIIIK